MDKSNKAISLVFGALMSSSALASDLVCTSDDGSRRAFVTDTPKEVVLTKVEDGKIIAEPKYKKSGFIETDRNLTSVPSKLFFDNSYFLAREAGKVFCETRRDAFETFDKTQPDYKAGCPSRYNKSFWCNPDELKEVQRRMRDSQLNND